MNKLTIMGCLVSYTTAQVNNKIEYRDPNPDRVCVTADDCEINLAKLTAWWTQYAPDLTERKPLAGDMACGRYI